MAHGLAGSAQLPEVKPSTWQGLLRSTLLRFLVVGGVSYIVNQTLLFALYEGAQKRFAALGSVNTGLLLASVMALEASMLVRFALNDRWTFGARHAKPFRQRLASRTCAPPAARRSRWRASTC